MFRVVCLVISILVASSSVSAQIPIYAPMSKWQSPLSRWEAQRSSLDLATRPNQGRPALPGLRPASVELLQDALLRKHPKLLQNDPKKARQIMLERYLGKGSERSRINGRNQLNGAMAEALFLQKNPDWKYVSKPNASQHDVYRTGGNKPPINGQIKFHITGNPSVYALDMVKDHRAHRFFVPDDHLQPLREYLLDQYESAKARGDSVSANQAARNAGRVQPMGVTSSEVVASTREAFLSASAEKNSSYVSLAAGVALSLGQIGWDYANGALSADQAAYRTTKALTLIGTGVVADSMLSKIRDGSFRGTLRGNLIVGGVVLLVETSWNIYEHGGMVAFRRPDFYEQLGGSVSAIGLGGAAGLYSGLVATGVASETGPFAPVIGTATGFVVGTGVGIIAYVGGRSATSWLVRGFFPELYQLQEQQQITAVRQGIIKRISDVQSVN